MYCCCSIRPIQEIGPRPRTRKMFFVLVVISLVGTISGKSLKLIKIVVGGAGSTKRSSVRPSVRLFVPSVDSSSGRFAAEHPAVRRCRSKAEDAGAQQQRRRSTALSSKCRQCRPDGQVDEAEHCILVIPGGGDFEIYRTPWATRCTDGVKIRLTPPHQILPPRCRDWCGPPR